MSHAVRRGHLKMSLNCFNLNTRVLNNVTMILTEKGREKKTLVWGLKWKLFPTKRQRRESANSQGRFSAWAGVHGKTPRLRVRCPRPSRDRVPSGLTLVNSPSSQRPWYYVSVMAMKEKQRCCPHARTRSGTLWNIKCPLGFSHLYPCPPLLEASPAGPLLGIRHLVTDIWLNDSTLWKLAPCGGPIGVSHLSVERRAD